jgi:hypothetical protein
MFEETGWANDDLIDHVSRLIHAETVRRGAKEYRVYGVRFSLGYLKAGKPPTTTQIVCDYYQL